MGNCISGPSQTSGHYELEETRHSRRATTAAPQIVQVEPSSSKPHRSSHGSSDNRGRVIASGSKGESSSAIKAPSQAQIEELLNHLRLVGETKLIGYLPIHFLTDHAHIDPESFRDQLEEKSGIKAIIFIDSKSSGTSLYCYDQVRFQRYLNLPDNKAILEKRGAPTNVDQFVAFLSDGSVAAHKDLYKLVAVAFDDKRPEFKGQLNMQSLS